MPGVEHRCHKGLNNRAENSHPVGANRSGMHRRGAASLELPCDRQVYDVEEDGWTATGDGIIDWEMLVPLFRRTKAEHIVTEHDNPADWRRFARRSMKHIKGLGL